MAGLGVFMRSRILVLAVILILSVASAQAGDWKLRLRVIDISPDDSSSEIVVPDGEGGFVNTGTGVAVDSAIVPEVDVTYMFKDNLGIELIAALAPHDLSTSGGLLGGADAGTVDVLPPTLTVQYFFLTDGALQPYIGAGVNFTTFPSYDLSDDLEDLGITDVEFSDSFGFAGNAGIDFYLGDHWLLNADVKYIQIDTDADLIVDGDTLETVSVDINPWVFGAGVGYRF